VSFKGDNDIRLTPPPAVRADLQVWAAATATMGTGLPIPGRPKAHLPSAIRFVSDASGAQFVKAAGRFVTLPYEGERGAASINAIEEDDIWFYANITWPKNFLLKYRDPADHAYGCKSATLEAIALILPVLCCPNLLVGREVTLLTDNEALVFGWEKRRVPHDNSASIFLKTLHIVSAFLGTSIEVRHLPRISCPSAVLADALTRSTTTTAEHRRLISAAPPVHIPEALLDWLENPSDDWNLPLVLLRHVQRHF
jgi:hypothetical protein